MPSAWPVIGFKAQDLRLLRTISHRHDKVLRVEICGKPRSGPAISRRDFDIAGNLYLIKLIKSLQVLSQALPDQYPVGGSAQARRPVSTPGNHRCPGPEDSAKGILLLKRHIQNSKRKLLEIIHLNFWRITWTQINPLLT